MERYHSGHGGPGGVIGDGGACPRRAAVRSPSLAARTASVSHLQSPSARPTFRPGALPPQGRRGETEFPIVDQDPHARLLWPRLPGVPGRRFGRGNPTSGELLDPTLTGTGPVARSEEVVGPMVPRRPGRWASERRKPRPRGRGLEPLRHRWSGLPLPRPQLDPFADRRFEVIPLLLHLGEVGDHGANGAAASLEVGVLPR